MHETMRDLAGALESQPAARGVDRNARELDELEYLAQRAGPALENARRYADARSLADIDALTAVHNRRYFHETLSREVARAHRHHRLLSLIVFDLDDFKSVNDKVGHLS